MILLKGEKVLGETNNNNFIMQPKVDYCFKELMKDLDVLKEKCLILQQHQLKFSGQVQKV